MDKLVETLGIASLSKSQVSRMAKELDEQVAALRRRPLDAGPYTFVWADALTQKVREGGRVVNVHALIAVGVNNDGHREILGLDVTSGPGRRRVAGLRFASGPLGLGLARLVLSAEAGYRFHRRLAGRGLEGAEVTPEGRQIAAERSGLKVLLEVAAAVFPQALHSACILEPAAPSRLELIVNPQGFAEFLLGKDR